MQPCPLAKTGCARVSRNRLGFGAGAQAKPAERWPSAEPRPDLFLMIRAEGLAPKFLASGIDAEWPRQRAGSVHESPAWPTK